MHELSIAESLIGMLEENRLTHHFTRVTKITLEIGVLAGIEANALLFCFAAVAQNSLAEGAQLIIESKPARAICERCLQQVSVVNCYDPCPHCGQLRVRILQGEEMIIKSLEVEN